MTEGHGGDKDDTDALNCLSLKGLKHEATFM